jgi:hypothetical protein
MGNLPCVSVPVSHSKCWGGSYSAEPTEQVVLVLLSSDFSSVSVGATKPGLIATVPWIPKQKYALERVGDHETDTGKTPMFCSDSLSYIHQLQCRIPYCLIMQTYTHQCQTSV